MAATLLTVGLLRSILRMDGSEPESQILQNVALLRKTVVPLGADALVVDFVGTYTERTGAAVDYQMVYSHFTLRMQQNDGAAHSVLTRLGVLQFVPFLDPSTFSYELDQYKEQVSGDTLAELMQQATLILTQGYTPPVAKGKPVLLQGAQAAVHYVEAGLGLLQTRFHTSDIEGSLRIDSASIWQEYQQRKAGGFQQGVLSGFTAIDDKHDGLMPGDLALVLGYTSQYKSTFCLNWAYHAAVYYQKNVGIVPLEMSAKTLAGMFAVIHCFNREMQGRYRNIKVTSDAFRKGTLDQLPPAERVADGKSVSQEEILKEALDDLNTNPKYGHLLYKEPQGAFTVTDIQRWAEREDRKQELHLLVVDYLGLVNSSSGANSLRESADANATVRETKQLCRSFANARGIAILSPWQASRDGFKEAEKNGGQYTLRAMSWANEAERSSDFVYSTYIDDKGKADRILKWGNLKARDREQIMGLGDLYCNPETRVIAPLDPTGLPAQNLVAQAMMPPPGVVPTIP